MHAVACLGLRVQILFAKMSINDLSAKDYNIPAQALSFDDINRIVKYLNQYVEQHAILLPGRIPGQKRDDVKLLPSSSSKRVKINKVLDIILSIQSSKH